MRARELAQPFPVVHLDTDALEATRLLVDRALPGLVVVDPDGLPLFILPGSQVLRFALPDYVEEDRTLAAVYSESDADALCESLRGRTVQELMPSERFLPRRQARRPIVAPDATLMEVAAAMAEQHSPVEWVHRVAAALIGAALMWSSARPMPRRRSSPRTPRSTGMSSSCCSA